MKDPIVVAGQTFATKKAISEHVRGIVASYEDNVDLSADDAAFMSSLLDRHREVKLKSGPGIVRWFIRPTEWGNRCFWIERVDGSLSDVSWTQCITSSTPIQDVRAAARSAVVDQITAFKASAIERHPFCAITGAAVTIDTAHVDHEIPFEQLVQEFFGDKVPDVEPTNDGETRTRFADPDVAAAFASFHKHAAKLRLVSAKVNLGDLRRGKR